MSNPSLSRSECNVLRGLAIIGIFLHNYCHWLGPIVKENEYQYFQHNVDWFNQVLVNPDLSLPFHLLSFFGHYGVPVFLFLSAYGLVLKYEAKPHLENATQFVGINGKKSFNWREDKIAETQKTGKRHFIIIVGLMLQLYIVYRLFIYRRHWGFTVGLMVICVAIQLALGFDNPESEAMNRYRYNFMGGMLPFGLGILYARYGEKILITFHHNATNFFGIIFCCSIIYSLSGSMIGWTFVPLFICLLSVLTAKVLSGVNWLSGINKVLEWMGVISAALFVCHPITRKIFIPISRQGDLYAGLLLYIISSICLAWLFSQLMKKIPNPQMKK